MRLDLDPSEFRDVIDRAVDQAVRRLESERPHDELGRVLLTKKEATDVMGVSQATVDRLRRDGGLPYVKLHGLVMFRPKALHAWAEAREETAEAREETAETPEPVADDTGDQPPGMRRPSGRSREKTSDPP